MPPKKAAKPPKSAVAKKVVAKKAAAKEAAAKELARVAAEFAVNAAEQEAGVQTERKREAAEKDAADKELAKKARAGQEATNAIEEAARVFLQSRPDIEAFPGDSKRRQLLERIFKAVRSRLSDNRYALLAFDRAADVAIGSCLKSLGTDPVDDPVKAVTDAIKADALKRRNSQ